MREHSRRTVERKSLPSADIIQGGMGIAVSDWRLARAVAQAGQIGVVSGTAIHLVLARRLASGDPHGDMRRGFEAFPDVAMAKRVWERWYVEGGLPLRQPYPQVPLFGVEPRRDLVELNILANFVEVYLAKERHCGAVGFNLLTKVQPPTLSALFGAMLAGVDVVIMGAGVPAQIPAILDGLAVGMPVELALDVEGASGESYSMSFDPGMCQFPALQRPAFLAIVSSVVLANYLARDENIRPDGFVVEGHIAGGHNAPPRSRDDEGNGVFGKKDEVDFRRIAGLGLPFWVAGGQADATSLRRAHEVGAAGVQIGSAFALCEESGLRADVKQALVQAIRHDSLDVVTDMRASASGYPFKVASVAGTLSDVGVYRDRSRVCDLGLLRTMYAKENGNIGYRCPAEPELRFVRKGGAPEDTEGRKCLCNGLLSAAGFPQVRDGKDEPSIVTMGSELGAIRSLVLAEDGPLLAVDVINVVLGRAK